MGRSLLGRLNLSDSVSDRFAEAQRDLASKYIRFDLLTLNPPKAAPQNIRVAVVGGGFAGLAAAAVLQNLHVPVTLYEARDHLGGRVETTRSLFRSPPERFLERGAELIGSSTSHRAWIRLAKDLGLGLSVITDEEMFEGMDLYPPLRIKGKALTPSEVKALGTKMEAVLQKLVSLAESVFQMRPPYSHSQVYEPWYEPWNVPFAARYDKRTLGSWIKDNTPSRPANLLPALYYGLSNDMAIDINKLSLLAMLTHIAGGGFAKYWTDTEVYRCEDGNQALATKLGERLEEGCPPADIYLGRIVKSIKVDATGVSVIAQAGEIGASLPASKYDFLILAVPPTVWSKIECDNWQLPQPIQCGPAVKFLAAAGSRYWVPKGYAPSGDDDNMGQLWESTDNQTGNGNIGLTVFAGGQYAEMIGKNPVEWYFKDRIETLLPGAKDPKNGLLPQYQYVDWPNEPYIETGYSAPAPGQVTGLQREMQLPRSGRIFLAGEHVCPPYFGFMEGALQSGIKAAERVATAAKIQIPTPPRELPHDTRGAKQQARPKCRPAKSQVFTA